jgi:hypothetical protein
MFRNSAKNQNNDECLEIDEQELKYNKTVMPHNLLQPIHLKSNELRASLNISKCSNVGKFENIYDIISNKEENEEE